MTRDLEDAANEIELRGGSGQVADMLRRIELERADAARKALEEAATALETKSGNELYRRAYRIAADFLRARRVVG